MMIQDRFLRHTLKMIVLTAIVIAGCRLTEGVFILAVALWGAFCAFERKVEWTIFAYALLSLLVVFNRAIIGLSSMYLLCARIGTLLIIFAVFCQQHLMHGARRVPLTGMWLYLLCACVSSADGWVPVIAYMKIVNFALMLLGIGLMARLIQHSDRDLFHTRAVMMAFATIMLVGSVITKFIPSVGYSMQLGQLAAWRNYLTAAELLGSDTMILFNGMTFHSQGLGPIAAMFGTWVLCDMLFAERRFTKLHCLNLLTVPFLMYLSRSRTSLLTIAVTMLVMFFYCLPKADLSKVVKQRVISVFTVIFVVMGMAALFVEIRDHSISKLIRKTDDVSGDTRSLTDAFTSSRMGLIEKSMYYWRQKPLLGNGFQVDVWHNAALRSGAINYFSAPIEKGTLPVMVLEEGGILGAVVMFGFLCVFYAKCIKERYMAMMTMMTAFVVSNLGEASFLSPSGIGGIEWMLTVLGGLSIDIVVHRQRVMHIQTVAFNIMPFRGQQM